MTGLTQEQFALLTNRLQPIWEEAERERLSRPDRQRAIGAGRRYNLFRMEDKLLALLMFYRFYLTDELMGWIVGLDASNVCRLRGKLQPLLEKAADPSLGIPLRLKIPKGAKKISTWEELLKVCPDFADVVTDATEQPRQRPQRRQRRWYSGKKKRHTIKTQITANSQERILAVSASHPGRVHDYRIFRQEGTAGALPSACLHFADLGYDGAQGDYPDRTMILPFKRRRNHRRLTRFERRFNRWHASVRIRAEHVLSRMKKYQILAQVWRHRIAGYNQTFRNIAALTNFRLAAVQA
jgi:hypothetical protein